LQDRSGERNGGEWWSRRKSGKTECNNRVTGVHRETPEEFENKALKLAVISRGRSGGKMTKGASFTEK